MTTHTCREFEAIHPLVRAALNEGGTFPNRYGGGVHILVREDATARGYDLAAALKRRHPEVDAFFAEFRPPMLEIDDGLPPMPDPASVDGASYLVHLAAFIAADDVRQALAAARADLNAIKRQFDAEIARVVQRAILVAKLRGKRR